ncbi:MAG: flagellar export chaperone FlgN [Planctomycetales bacterium]|nr:flagellar export chaperone FlgN [Planctomycetales bacterium]
MMPHPLTAIDDRLADECIAHLARELSVLETQRATLLDVNAALLQHNVTRFEHAAARQDEAAEMGVQIREFRNRLMDRLADKLHMPAGEITLSSVAANLVGDRQQHLAELQSRLQTVAAEVMYLQRKSALVMQRAMLLFDHLIRDLTGETDAAECYDATGRIETSGRAAFVQTEC